MKLKRALQKQGLLDVDFGAPLMPLVDVVFLLMIFFLFGSTRLAERQLLTRLAQSSEINLPASKPSTWLTLRTADSGAVEHRVDGGVWFDGEALLSVELSRAIQSPRSSGVVTVDAKAGVSFQAVIDALALGGRCGATHTALHMRNGEL